ncbi:energy transducer TonB [Stenotrophomonas sp. 24(2023)]|uniref:energy transducer TonB n=1 Tax=Stenotrophomonas sp. 24(2023) TaxID=3068324 RepID=UPI0027DEDAF4|nr:energy transducer TonB [Stenotrophomonas sp. 24(2023)]WMJ70022.1 energy transducer TonB [Stenotrophomonas sp. 24(2023)]
MVRTYPVVPLRFDPARVAAWSAALALHLLALLLLLIPAAYQATPLPREKTQVRLITRVEPPPLPPRDVTAPPKHVQVVPQPRTVPTPPLPAPTAVIEDAPAFVLPAAAPDTAPALPSLAPSTPQVGAELHYRSAPPPAYPAAALRANQQGTVLLRVEVGSDGRPVNVTIERSSGARALDQAARSQVLNRWTFEPAQRDGVAVPAIGLVPIDFSLPR